ncbi:Choline transport protein [Cladophialophora carrionii]|uniref:Choline transport protein n=1 Tax=Cladophialophora carrionii TaxID=86049 RepID=A0A1C1CV30_9EURO|nr:Choline transport protein [Cladophialophora carrionii]
MDMQKPKLESVNEPPPELMLDNDEHRLAEMGYRQEMSRNFSVWSVLGLGFSLTNSWWAVSAAMVTGINSGGPVLFVYGIIGLFIAGMGIAISLSELVSAYPNAAGQHFWVSQLAPERSARFLSYLTGWFVWAGSIFASASVALSVGSACVGCYQLTHPDLVIEAWHVFVAYQLVNLFAFIFNCYGRMLPVVTTVTLYTTLISFVVILITVPARAPSHTDAKFVFATFINNTGWSSSGIAFIVGLINPNWGFSCLDTVVHIAEEVHRPERLIPIGIIGTVVIGFVTSFTFSISMMYSLNNFDDIVNTSTGVPILELFFQALQTKAGAIALEALVIATGIGCQIACHTWQSRLCWSFARDKGIPFHGYLSKVHPTLEIPIRAHAVCCAIVALLGCLYLGSYTAIASIISACIVLPYVSYCIPVTLLLYKGRDNIRHGPFWLGKLGLVANIVLLCFTTFAIVMYSLPTVMPVKADNMNYVSAVYGIIILIIIVDWSMRARRQFRLGTDEIDGLAVMATKLQ